MKKHLLLALSLVTLLASCGSSSSAESGSTKTSSATGQTSDVSINSDSISSDFALTNGAGTAITSTNGVYSIAEAGVYTASGKLAGQIYINAPSAEVELDLNGVSITNDSVSPIFVKDCAEFNLKVLKGTSNYVYDNRTTDYSETTDETIGTAAIYSSNGDIKIKGSGTLSVTSLANSGITGKDNVTVKNVTMLVKAVNNGIKGNDKVTIEENPTLGIVAGNNGIRTSNSDKGSSAQHGYIYINGGNITINSYGDGIDAEYGVEFGTSLDDDGNTCVPVVDIYTNIYSSYSYSTVSSAAKQAYSGPGRNGGGFDGGGMNGGKSAEKADDSAKGIKANESINVNAGQIYCYTYDDGIHANKGESLENGSTSKGNITIGGGTLNLKASDDAIHADGTLSVTNGTITIAESHEGLEANAINISGGEMTIYASDDAVNACASIVISGGRVDVNMPASGDVDGLDSNGTFSISGGTVITRGPNSDMAAPIDTDGTLSLTGGTLIVIGYCPRFNTNLTKSTSTSGLSSGSHTVTIGNQTISYTNSYSYSGSTTVYGSGSATVK